MTQRDRGGPKEGEAGPGTDLLHLADLPALLGDVPVITYVTSPDILSSPRHVGPHAELVLGYPPQAWIDDPDLWLRRIHTDDRARVERAAEACLGDWRPWIQEYRMLARDGRVVSFRDEATPVPREGADGRCWRGVLIEVSHRRHPAGRLRPEERYRHLVERVPVVVYVDTPDPDPITLYMSPQIEALLGFPAKDFVDDPTMWVRRLHPDDRERMIDANHEFARTGDPLVTEYRLITRDGRVVWIHDQTNVVKDADGRKLLCQGVMLDITERKQVEEALSRSEAKYRALVEGVPAVVYTAAPDDDSTTLYVGPQVEQALGYSRQEWLDQPDIWMELLHPDDREPTLAAHDRHNETGEPWTREYRLIASDGREVWFRDEAKLVRDPEGRPMFWHGIRMDITDRKLAEEALHLTREELEKRVMERTAELAEANEMMMLEIGERKATERRLQRAEAGYRALVERTPGMVAYIWTSDPAHPERYVGPQIEALLGFTPEEWHASSGPTLECVHPDDRDRLARAVMRSEETGEPFRLEYRLVAADGHIVRVLDHAVALDPSHDGHPRVFQGIVVDIGPGQARERPDGTKDGEEA